MRRTKSFFWLLLSPVLTLLLAYVGVSWKQQHPQNVTVVIGPFTNAANREVAALKELSRQVKRFPNATIYRINLKGNQPPKNYILFYKHDPQLGLGPQAGIIWFNYLLVDQAMMKRHPLAYTGITDESINSHAEKSHRFEDILPSF